MGFINDAIEEACSVTGILAEKISVEKSSEIRKCVEDRYTGNRRDTPLWERLEEDNSIYDPNGWKTIGEFPYNDKIMIFFDIENESAMYSVISCSDLVKLLSECPGFVFYLTDAKCSFVLCHNDHDYLIGVGTAKDWIRKLQRKTGSENNCSL